MGQNLVASVARVADTEIWFTHIEITDIDKYKEKQMYTKIQTSENWAARVVKVADMDVGYTNIQTSENWVAIVAKGKNMDKALGLH